jgi:hypothetical protein
MREASHTTPHPPVPVVQDGRQTGER